LARSGEMVGQALGLGGLTTAVYALKG